MKVVVNADILSGAAQLAGKATTKRDAYLSSVLIEANGEAIKVTGTDRDIMISAYGPASVPDPGTALVNGAILSSLAGAANGPVTLHTEDGALNVSAGRARWRLNTFNTDSFAKVEHLTDGPEIEAGAFQAALKRVLPAASTDNTRPVLRGVRFDQGDGGCSLVATDGFRLSVLDLGYRLNISGPVTVPTRALSELTRVKAGTIIIAANENVMTFSVPGQVEITTRLIDGDYPDHRLLLDRYNLDGTSTLVAPRKPIVDALKRVGLLSDEAHHVIVIEASEGDIRMQAQGDAGNASEQLEGEYKGEYIKAGFNVRYLAEGLEAAGGDQVLFTLDGSLKPVFLRSVDDDSFIQLLMPVRVV